MEGILHLPVKSISAPFLMKGDSNKVFYLIFICMKSEENMFRRMVADSLIGLLMCVDDVLSTYIMLACSNCSEFTQYDLYSTV